MKPPQLPEYLHLYKKFFQQHHKSRNNSSSSNELWKVSLQVDYANLRSIRERAREPYSSVASKRLTTPPSCAALLLSCHLAPVLLLCRVLELSVHVISIQLSTSAQAAPDLNIDIISQPRAEPPLAPRIYECPLAQRSSPGLQRGSHLNGAWRSWG